jgi:hypothetical protein
MISADVTCNVARASLNDDCYPCARPSTFKVINADRKGSWFNTLAAT